MAPTSKFKILGNFRHRNILRVVDVSNVFFLGCWLGFGVWCLCVRVSGCVWVWGGGFLVATGEHPVLG